MPKKAKKSAEPTSYVEEIRVINGQKVKVKVYDPVLSTKPDANPVRPMYVQNQTTNSASSGTGSSIRGGSS